MAAGFDNQRRSCEVRGIRLGGGSSLDPVPEHRMSSIEAIVCCCRFATGDAAARSLDSCSRQQHKRHDASLDANAGKMRPGNCLAGCCLTRVCCSLVVLAGCCIWPAALEGPLPGGDPWSAKVVPVCRPRGHRHASATVLEGDRCCVRILGHSATPQRSGFSLLFTHNVKHRASVP